MAGPRTKKPPRISRTPSVKDRPGPVTRRARQAEAGEDLEATPGTYDPADYPHIVVTGHGHMAEVRMAEGVRRLCHVRLGGKQAVVVGDRVRVERIEDEYPVVSARMPRRTRILRPAPHGQIKTVAANVDRLVVVSAVEPPLREGLVDRYLVAAEWSGIAPILVLNKIDLDEDRTCRARMEPYRALGYPVVFTSARTGEGIAELGALLVGLESAVVGHSGVGKSSLINRLVPGAHIPTREISGATGRGRHVTSASALYELPGGGFLVDSPGIRAFGLFGIAAEDVAPCFPEFRPLIPQCRFDDCLHAGEEGCAVARAVQMGTPNARRYESYRRILESVRSGEWA